MDLGLKGRGAIGAAASKGLGRAVAEEFCREGAEVAICARTGADLETAARAMKQAHGREVFWQAVDVTRAEEVSVFVGEAERRFGRGDICVTNAGGAPGDDVSRDLAIGVARASGPDADERGLLRARGAAADAEEPLGTAANDHV